MRKKFWMAFYDVKKAAFYYQIYGISSSHWVKIISTICSAVSVGFVASWYFSKTSPGLWAFLTVGCQIFLAYQPFSSFSKREVSAEYIFQDLNKLAQEAEKTWGIVKVVDDKEKINGYTDDLLARQDAIEERFATASTFPMNAWIHRKAKKKANEYFRRFKS